MLIEALPEEILKDIITQLPLKDAVYFSQASKTIFSLFRKSQDFWKAKLAIYFPYEAKQLQKPDTNFNYFEYFKSLYEKFTRQDFYEDLNREKKVLSEKRKYSIRLYNYAKEGNLAGILALREQYAPKSILWEFLSAVVDDCFQEPAQYWICYFQHQEILNIEYQEAYQAYFINKGNYAFGTKGYTHLHWTARCNQIQAIESTVNQGVPVDQVTKNTKRTALEITASYGYFDASQLLLALGANVNHSSNDGSTPLSKAAANGHDQIVQMLLMHGASVDSVDERGHIPLFDAARGGWFEVAKQLIIAGSNVHHIPHNGETSLHAAVLSGNFPLVKLFIDHGVQLFMEDTNGFTPLHVAAKCGLHQVAELMLSRNAKPNAKTSNGCTPLFLAAENGYAQVVELLLSKGAKLNEKTYNGITSLYIAAKNDHAQVVELLLSKGAKPNEISTTHKDYIPPSCTPLYIAAENGYAQVVERLLSMGAQIDVAFNGCTPLYLAAQNGHAQVVELLLSTGAKPNEKTPRGGTPLYIAAEKGHRQVVKTLLFFGADPNQGVVSNQDFAKSHSIRTPYEIAKLNGHHSIVTLLHQAIAKNEVIGIVQLNKNLSTKQQAIALYTWYANQKTSLWHRFEYWREAQAIVAKLKAQSTFTEASFTKILLSYDNVLSDTYFNTIATYITSLFRSENVQENQAINQNTDNNNASLKNLKL